ncbi:MAG TPA: helix-turn-helix transcriptional regulator [Pseudonocardia sp.]|nr:helix-turn-helix transcriptional regulator [Pseudonocardia sp.]
MPGSALTLQRVQRDVEVLAHAGLDTATFLAEAYESLQRAVPSSAACMATLDPATQLVTGAFKFGALAGCDDTDEIWGQLEYGHVEPTSFTELGQAGVTAVGMHVSTHGDGRRSRRVRELVQAGLGCTDELRVLAAAGGQVWGGLALFRDDRCAPYREDDVEFMASLSGLLAHGLRVGLLARLAVEPPSFTAGDGPSVMVFGCDGRPTQVSVGAEARLAQLMQGAHRPVRAVIGSLVAAAWRYAAGLTEVLPSSRLRLRSGEWVVLHASPLTAADGSTSSVVITLEEARPPEIVPLVVAAFDLTGRERDVIRLVLQGLGTREIAATLHVSPHTVQDHLKSIFTKTGVSSRRELVARVFFDQYVPRLGGPLSPTGFFLGAS